MDMPDSEVIRLRTAIAALEAQRSLLGDAVVETAIGPLREKVAALEAKPPAEQTRKQATVLFADVSGFTTIAETMDAEVVAGIMNDLWAMVDRSIIEHGGHIDKHIGDAVMALWGADAAREDDPERAVRAALAMQTAMAAFCATHSAPLSMRIGVNTGPVVLGAVGTTGEFTAMGDTVNLASRLEHAAPVGGLLIGHDTYRLVRGIFDVQPQAPLAVKGKAELVQTYIVLRARPRAFHMVTRGVEGVETRMVGRDAELDTLKNAYLDAFESAKTRVAIVVGEAGVGKSRLLHEFKNWLDQRPEQINYYRGRSTPNTQNVPYNLFRDLFADHFGVLDSDPTAVVLDKFRRGMAVALEPDLADVVGHWLGFDFSSSGAVQRLLGGSNLMATARAFLMRYFRALSEPAHSEKGLYPTVILLEDIHWADDPSLDLATHLATSLPAAHLLIVALTRPALFERRPSWGEDEALYRRIPLKPLSRHVSLALVGEILKGVDQVPDKLRDLIIDAAEGNPFYVEEMVKMLIEQDVIERGGAGEQGSRGGVPNPDHWTVHEDRLATLAIPPTLTALLQARLDGLPRPEREALQRASVIGRLFWDDAVADLLEADSGTVVPILDSVRGRELIFRREQSAFAGVGEYIFKHALLRDVTYETVLLKRRAAFHSRAARWLETHAGERHDEYLTLIAEHFILAGEELQAATLLEQSGHELLKVSAHAQARRTLERALALREAAGETDSPAITAALIGIGQACNQLGDYPAAEAALERGLAAARAAGDRAAEAEALTLLADLASDLGDFDRAWALAEAALPLGCALGGRLFILTQRRAAFVLRDVGRLDEAETHAGEALAASRAAGDLPGEIMALNALGMIATTRRELERSKEIDLKNLSLARQANLLSSEATALVNLGDTYYLLGDYPAARAYGQMALERFEELGLLPSVALANGNIAQADLRLGDVDAARRGVSETLRLARSLGHLPHLLWAVFLYGQILAETGDKMRALALYGLVQAHPALVSQEHVELDEEIDRLGLPPEEVEAGLAVGAKLNIETVIQEILDGKWQG